MLADNETYTVALDGTLRDDSVELHVVFRSTLESKIRRYTDFSYLIRKITLPPIIPCHLLGS